jgi:hypothetical protein
VSLGGSGGGGALSSGFAPLAAHGGGGALCGCAGFCIAMGDITTVVVAVPGAMSFAVRPARNAAQHAAAPQKKHASGATTKMRITKITIAATAPGASAWVCAAPAGAPNKDCETEGDAPRDSVAVGDAVLDWDKPRLTGGVGVPELEGVLDAVPELGGEFGALKPCEIVDADEIEGVAVSVVVEVSELVDVDEIEGVAVSVVVEVSVMVLEGLEAMHASEVATLLHPLLPHKYTSWFDAIMEGATAEVVAVKARTLVPKGCRGGPAHAAPESVSLHAKVYETQ